MEESLSYLSFRIGNEYYAIHVCSVQSIIEYTRITKIPQTPAHFLGIINLRGEVLPVLDLRVRFGLTKPEITLDTCIIVVEIAIKGKQMLIGTLVDGVSEVIEIEKDSIDPVPSLGRDRFEPFITGFHHQQEQLLMILDIHKIFASEEIVASKKLAGVA
ncbi:MAG: purine-binding chemotaxis protein CheW [Bacteroidales bacterium]|nr:purine-binding chemotaxis protein CheW [Bacteroidales bacterium]